MKKELITKIDPKSPVSEVFRALRTNIQYMGKAGKAQSMVVTSTMQGEGKSWVISNLAVTFAQAGKNVVLIDADMRRPRQNNIFGVDMYPGLSNYLSGVTSRGTEKEITVRDCVQPTEIDNLYIIPAGNIPPNPSELLSSPKTKELVDELKKIFDIVIFDGAPCLVVTDSTVISRVVDYTLLVASQKTTKIEDLKDAKRQIESVGGHVVGVVLNRVKMSSKKYENRYYYTQNTQTGKREKHRSHDYYKIDVDDDYKKTSRSGSRDEEETRSTRYSNEQVNEARGPRYSDEPANETRGSRYSDELANEVRGSRYSDEQVRAEDRSSKYSEETRGTRYAEDNSKVNDIINQIKKFSEGQEK